MQRERGPERRRWKGLRLIAGDKTNLALPESQALWEYFGAHGGSRGLGPVGVELCRPFDLVTRTPLRFVYGRASTSEHRLLPKLISYLKKGNLLLFDSGFHSFRTLAKITGRAIQFIIAARKQLRPEALRKLGDGDYLCRIRGYRSEKAITVRVVFVRRNGFRRRRLNVQHIRSAGARDPLGPRESIRPFGFEVPSDIGYVLFGRPASSSGPIIK